MGRTLNPRPAFRPPQAAQIAGFALLAVSIAALALGGALPTLGTRLLGIGGVDHSGTLWVYEQVREALAGASGGAASLAHTSVFYYPWGQDMLHNTGINVVDALLAAPFSLLGRIPGHNAFLLCVLLANGLAAMAYARDHTPSFTAAALAGLAFAIAPYPLYELLEGRPAQALLVGMVFYLRALKRAVHGTGSPWTAALWLGILGYQYWFYGIFAALGTLVGGVAWALRPPEGRSTPAVLGVLLRVAAGAALCVSPFAVPMLAAMRAGTVPGLIGQTPDMLLHSYQPARGMVGFFDGGQFVGTQRALPLALAVAALARARKRAGPDPDRVPELLIGALALLLAIGPTLLIGARAVPEPLYVALSAAIPPLQRLWHPARALAMLAVLGIGWFARMRRPAQLLVLAVGVIAAVRDGLLPFPTWDPTLPAGYQCLSARSGEADHAALLELPLAGSQRHLGYQSVHHRPISGGMHEAGAAFQPAEAVQWRASDPYARGLYALARGAAPDAALGDGAAVHALGYGYVVLQKDALPTGETAGERTLRRRIEGGLEGALGAPIWDDARTTVWAPWGDPLPCSASPPARDETPAGPLNDRAVKDLGRWPAAQSLPERSEGS